MPKFHDLSEYAAAIAPIIDAAHVNLHAAALRSVTDLAESSGVTPGLLVDLRFTLPLRPLTRPQLVTLYRYGDAALRELDDHLREGTMTEDPGGLLRPTRDGLACIRYLRGNPRLQAGEESDPCGAGQGQPIRRQANRRIEHTRGP
ncbi:hypothetical protein [Nonomuraea sp. B1E8]|uniref:hypothetical protein n=1 Tax=unclassified Nonomuraea TaxID=2593643 RepID=UPI00325C7EB6